MKQHDDNDGPYIYTSNFVPRGNGRRRKAKEEEVKQPAKEQRQSVKKNIQPHADFGARLFSGLLAGDEVDSPQKTIGVRRRAYTEIDDLLENDMELHNKSAFKDQEVANSDRVKNEQSNLLATPASKERKREAKLAIKEQEKFARLYQEP